MIRLMIVDDNRMLRLGLEAALESGGGIELVGSFDLGEQTVIEMEGLKPDVVLMVMKWSVVSLIETSRKIRYLSPETKVLMLAAEARDEDVLASIMAGASGYVSMNARRSELIRVVHVVAGGGYFFERGVVDRVIGRLQDMNGVADVDEVDALTERDVLILNMIAGGRGNEEIGASLGVATPTVRNIITRLRAKLSLHSRTQLAAYAVRREILHEFHSVSNRLRESE